MKRPFVPLNRVKRFGVPRSPTHYAHDLDTRKGQAMLDIAFALAIERVMRDDLGYVPLEVLDATCKIYHGAERAMRSAVEQKSEE